MRKIRFLKFLIIILVLINAISLSVFAGTPYITRTLNRYGDLVQTQDAYEPMKSIKSFVNQNSIQESFNSPQDIFIDANDVIYLADTKNARILIFDKNWNLLNAFGNDILIQPLGIFVRDNYLYVADFGDPNDNASGKVVIYSLNKENMEETLYKTLTKPESTLLEIDNFIFRPQKIAVDSNYTMYIVNQGSSNGILLVNSNNRFLNYFAPNSTKGTLKDLITDFFWGNNEKVLLTKKIPPAPTNVMLDDSGYIYTVTRTIVQNNLGDTLKKVNIGGLNFYPVDMVSAGSFVDSWSSHSKTIYALTANGFIYEYDIEGNLLFVLSGPIATDEQLGLFKSASAIAVDSNGNLIVLDDNANTIQILRKTNFTNNVHVALEQYMSGRYLESKDLWEEVLRYNSMFDLAHKGIGMANFLDGEYQQAMDKFVIANAKEEYSEAFWELRNIWLMNHISLLFIVVLVLFLSLIAFNILNKKYAFSSSFKGKMAILKEKPFFSSFYVMGKFIRHPMDAVYEVRYNKKIKLYNALIVMMILFGIYILNLLFTGFLFNSVILEKTILVKEAMKIVFPVALFIVSNYFISSLMSGEGTFKSITINTCGSMMPVILMLPFIILISNVLTFNESFIYYFAITIMFLWSGVLLFVVIKETHNFSVKQTIINFILTIFMMLIIIVVIILLYLIVAQVFGFIVDLIKEAVF